MLILTGTHCVSGRTGLTDPALLHYKFYEEDCKSVGVEPREEDDLQPLTEPEKKIYKVLSSLWNEFINYII